MQRVITKLKSVILVAMAMILGLSSISPMAGAMVASSGQSVQNPACDMTVASGNITLCKTAQEVPGMVNTWDITLKIKSKKVTTTSDTVLVIDRSGSMNNNGRMPAAKTAARSFVNTLLPDGDTTNRNRIALVSFAGEVQTNSNFTNNAATLISAIDGLNANGGTYTQAAIHEAQGILAASTADYKTIVLLSDGEPTYSARLNNPDDYLIPYAGYGGQTGTSAPQTAYQYNSRVGSGSLMLWRYYDGWGNSNDKYYNHGNSTIAEAGFAKNADGSTSSTIYTVALQAGTQGNGVLNAVASPDSAYTANPDDLQQIFDEIAGKISNFIKDANVVDQMGAGVIVENGDKTLNWTPTFTQEGDFFVAEKTYRIQLDGTKLVDGWYDANKFATLTYNGGQTANFPVPQVDPTFVKISKVLEGDNCPGCKFTFKITLPDGTSENRAVVAGDALTLFHPMLVGKYQIAEVSAEDADGNNLPLIQYDSSLAPEAFMLAQGGTDVSVVATNKLKKVDIQVEKKWAGKPGSEATIRLWNGQTEVGSVTLASNPWKHTFTGLPQYTRDGQLISYTVTEDEIKDENGVNIYETEITGSASEGYLVTNTYKSPTKDITATKKWVGGSVLTRPNITLTLWRQGESALVDSCTLTHADYTDNEGSCTWTKMPINDTNGNPYTYYVKETIDGISGTYTSTPDVSGLVITNTYNIPKDGEVEATKTWINGPEAKPTVWFKLYRQVEGGAVEEVPVEQAPLKELADGVTTVKWTDLDTTDSEGRDYTFSVKEVDADGNDFTPESYTKVESGLTVTNTYVIPTNGSATATKTWVNGPSDKPTVWFKLYRQIEGGAAEEVSVSQAPIKELPSGTLSASWNNLEETDINGNPYTFSVKEVDASGNDFTPENYTKLENGLTVTNTYKSPEINLTVKKDWKDGELVRPSQIEVYLYRKVAGGSEEQLLDKTVTIGANILPEAWTYTWKNLPKTDNNGSVYEYSVKERDLANFNPVYVASDDGLTITITNTYSIPKTAISVTKKWNHGEDIRPDSVTVNLLRDGSFYKTTTLNDINGWFYRWDDLNKTDSDGKTYVYSVEELLVNRFTTDISDPSINDEGEASYVITNTYKSPIIDINVEKIWVDELTVHPDVEISLLRDGEVVDSIVLGEEYGWTHTWSVDETDEEGDPYTYTVAELVVPQSYVAMVDGSVEDGFVITNTYFTPGKGGGEPVEPKSPALADTGLNSYLAVLSGMMLAGIGIYLLPIRRQQ